MAVGELAEGDVFLFCAVLLDGDDVLAFVAFEVGRDGEKVFFISLTGGSAVDQIGIGATGELTGFGDGVADCELIRLGIEEGHSSRVIFTHIFIYISSLYIGLLVYILSLLESSERRNEWPYRRFCYPSDTAER